jgi:riboflavin kinase/FMN adenylyltransferase
VKWPGLPDRGSIARDVALTIGNFDGVHRGHQRLLRRLVRDAERRRASAVVVTFDPHPRCVVDPHGCPPALTSVDERVTLLMHAGASDVIVLDFTAELSRLSAERFIDMLLESLAVRRIFEGPGFALGHARTGDAAFLSAYGARKGFDVVTVAPAISRGRPVSSGRVRAALMAGRLGEANALLGRSYRLEGTVVSGDERGRTLGFPTANVATDPGRCLPAPGIYATWCGVGEEWRRAATSIGYRPTFGGKTLTVEAYVLDFEGDLYGERVRLEFVARLRGERAYPDVTRLVAQMQRDVDSTRRRLDARKPPHQL